MLIGIVAGDDGSVVLAGYTLGVWGFESSGDADFAAVKLDENGIEVWRWQVIRLLCADYCEETLLTVQCDARLKTVSPQLDTTCTTGTH